MGYAQQKVTLRSVYSYRLNSGSYTKKYPWDKLKKGDSFFIPYPGFSQRQATNIAQVGDRKYNGKRLFKGRKLEDGILITRIK